MKMHVDFSKKGKRCDVEIGTLVCTEWRELAQVLSLGTIENWEYTVRFEVRSGVFVSWPEVKAIFLNLLDNDLFDSGALNDKINKKIEEQINAGAELPKEGELAVPASALPN